MNKLLYFPDNEYQKKFDSEVTKVRESSEKKYDGWICLEETLFYKEGGGQPADHGKISWNGKNAEVVDVQKEHGEIRHYIDGDTPEEGEKVEART